MPTPSSSPDPVTLLKQDHRDAAALLQVLKDSKPGARRRQTVDKLVRALQLHMEVEEQLVYPVVRRQVDAEQAEEASIEHQLARDALMRLPDLVDAPGFGAAVAMLTAGIRHHVKEEETEMFPDLKKKVDRSEVRTLGQQIAAFKKRTK